MSLDLARLENIRARGDGFTARCPACAEAGMDGKGNHLWSRDREGVTYGCTVNPLPGGQAHRSHIFSLVGRRDTGRPGRHRQATAPCRHTPVVQRTANTKLPALFVPTDAELDALADGRQWPRRLARPGLRILADRGLLWVASYLGRRAWIVTDSTHYAWRARRLDRQHWWGKTKTTTEGPSLPGWIIGADTIGNRVFVILSEGEADLLASAMVAYAEGCDLSSIAFVCVFGAVEVLDSLALSSFAGKSVLVVQQNDAEHGKGAKTAEAWLRQLHSAGAMPLSRTRFDSFKLPTGKPCKDLGEYAETLTDSPGPAFLSPFLSPTPRPPLIPLESPWQDGMRYRDAGACEVASRLDCYLVDPAGPWIRRHGVLLAVHPKHDPGGAPP